MKRVGVRPRVTYRYAHHVNLVWPNDPNARSYIVQGTDTLSKVYAGTWTTMFNVTNGRNFLSPRMSRTGLGMTGGESTKGLTTAAFDIAEYSAPGNNIRSDDDILFLRISRVNQAGTTIASDTVLVLPPPSLGATPQPLMTFKAAAAAIAGTTTGVPPDSLPGLVFPSTIQSIQIRNLDDADSVFVSFDRGMPEVEVPFAQVESFVTSGTEHEIFVRCDNAKAANFTMYVTLLSGSY